MKKFLITLLCTAVLISIPVISCSCTDPVQPTENPEPDPKPEPEPEPDPEPEFVEEPDDTQSDPLGIYDFSVLNGLGHPRLLMNADDFTELRTKLNEESASNRTLCKIHDIIIGIADSYVASDEPLEYTFDAADKRLLAGVQSLTRIFPCAYAFRTTGDEKYLHRAEAYINDVCSFKNWNATQHFLDAGELALAVALGYDWLYYDLAYDTRVAAHKALVKFALTPSKDHWFRTAESNWNQVCYCGVTCAALTLYEKDRMACATVIADALKNNATSMKALYSPDGNYPEGYSYWGYGTTFEVLMLTALEQTMNVAQGLIDTPGFDRTGEYMLFMAGSVGKCFDYSDSVTSEFAKYAMWWFAVRQNDPSLLVNELRLLNAGRYTASEELRLLAMVPCLAKEITNLDNVSASVPSQKLWSGNGITPVVMIHTTWSYDRNDKYVGIKGGKASANHGHMDAGSFVYDAYGVRWSEDLGVQAYAPLESALTAAGGHLWTMTQGSMRWQVYRYNNLSHSTLTVNNSDHRVDGNATIEQLIESNGELGAKLKMTPVFTGQLTSAFRTVKLVDEKDLYIIDELTAPLSKAATVEWRMMTGVNVAVGSDCLTLTSGAETMYLTASSSDSSVDVAYTTWSAQGTRSWDDANAGMTVAGYTATIPAGASVTLTTKLSITK